MEEKNICKFVYHLIMDWKFKQWC